MAEGGARSAAVCRSVSLQGPGAGGARRPWGASSPPPSSSSSSSFFSGAPRKVSKICAAATAEPRRSSSSISTSSSSSVRQLTEKFDGSGASSAATRACRAPTTAHSGTDSVSGSDSERRIAARLRASRRTTDEEEEEEEEEDVPSRGAPPPRRSHRSFSSRTSDLPPPHSDLWPSVTKIRRMFDEGPGKDAAEVPRPENLRRHWMDSRIPDGEASCRARGTPGAPADPERDLRPPAAAARRWCEETARERRVSQGVGLHGDSLHSSHSSSRALAPAPTPLHAPTPHKASAAAAELNPPSRPASSLGSRWRFSSGDEEEEERRWRRGASRWSVPPRPAAERGGNHLFRSNNGIWGAKGIGRSSGSEEDGPGCLGAASREAFRRRSLRKKKKVGVGVAAADNGEDSDSDAALSAERGLMQSAAASGRVSRSHSAREPGGGARVQQRWERISSPPASATLPGISRVSKVNIPPFLCSPGGSRCSSRYSSTETLKEEDAAGRTAVYHVGGTATAGAGPTSSSVMSKTFYGNFTMYRSPSFGHGDNFSRTPVRVRPKVAPAAHVREAVAPKTTAESGVGEQDRISMSNPDMTLLSSLKPDPSERKVRKCGEGAEPEGPPQALGRRLSLKDLTATLRRAKSFTYSGKPAAGAGVHCYLARGAAKRSSSEQQLDVEVERDGGGVFAADREVESDGGDFRVTRGRRIRDYGYGGGEEEEEALPTALQELYAKEARQVIRDICQMNTREEEDVDIRRAARNSAEEEEETDGGGEFKNRNKQEGEAGGWQGAEEKGSVGGAKEEVVAAKERRQEMEGAPLLKGDSEESVRCNRSGEELSGHESSLTDEGVVMEPEAGPPSGTDAGSRIARDVLGQPVTFWKRSALHQEEGTPRAPPHAARLAESDSIIMGAEVPAMPGAARRRRKFSPSSNGTDFGNLDNGESAAGNGESAVYRSLSDPMPQRCCSPEPGGGNFSSLDSNLLGSLSVKGSGAEPTTSGSEHKGSAASDLSSCGDGGVRDYVGVIRSIVAEPGAMDGLVTDEHSNGKTPKKKSFSDPSRRSDVLLLPHNDTQVKGQIGSGELIGEPEHAAQIPPSSSEPILNERREEQWVGATPAGSPRHRHGNSIADTQKPCSPSECGPSSDIQDEEEEEPAEPEAAKKFNFDLKLAEVLLARTGRRRPARPAQFFPHEDPFEPSEFVFEEQEDGADADDITPPLPPPKPKARHKHVRHASEPTTFVPISPLPPTRRGASVDDTPSLEDVSQRYILERSASERDGEGPAARDGAEVAAAVTAAEGPSGGPVSGTTTQKKDSGDVPSILAPQRTKPRVDMRKHVMMTLLDTEQSYVESLRTLIQGYMRPLKQPDGGAIVDPLLVDEMFYQIPEILEHHELFLEQVSGCVGQWHDQQTVGHILIQSFSKETLANMYSAYIDNFLNAKDAVRIAKEAKPAFHKFLEQNMRENKEKQGLGDLMIKPVQRIPRYELLVNDLLKHTPEDHPDHPSLLDAQRDIKRLAERINKGRRSAEEAEREARVIQEIEAHIEGVEHILNPERKFLRQEMVMEAKTVGGKKDRSLFLFSDLIICTTLKRKSGSLRRSSMSLYSAASVIDTSSKYKFLWKLPLEDVEVVKSSTQATNKENVQKVISRLDEDLGTLGQISKLSEAVSFPHQSLDEVIKELLSSVHRELSEKQSLAFSMALLPTKLELSTVSAEASFVFEFSSPDARSNFELAFEEAKKKLAMTKDQWDPEFLKAIPIMKTRSGMQFSCASPSHTCPDSGCEVWVCNSDGYVGQVCLLNIREEPTVEACIAVCSARIICIAAVPGLKGRERGSETRPVAMATPTAGHGQQQLYISISHSSLELSEQPTGPGAELVPFDSDDTDDEDSPSPSSTLQSQASHSTISSSFGNDEGPGSKDLATETTSSEEEQEFPVAGGYCAPGMPVVGGGGGGGCRGQSESPMDGRAMRRSSRGSFTRASLEDLLSIDPEAYQSSVWLGTEDGCIHVYQSSDNIRNRKNSMKMQHSASILCVLYLDNKVFVSLANGEVIVYQREAGSFWDPQSSQTLVLGTPSSPITKMVPVGGKLWCGSQNRILIINSNTLVQEHCFQVGTDSSRCVTCMVAYGQGVWLALQGSAQVRLYHALTGESLSEVDVAPAVHKMLAGADAIIRQHKAACLRITALLACKDLLWIGTSAGVVLTLPIPAVSSGTAPGTLKAALPPMGSAHGHTGHVRFLTSIELPEGVGMNFPPPPSDATGNQQQSATTTDGNLQRRDSARRRASAHLPPKTNHLVISGGDGYEDFRLTSSSETVGRDDSTNHLLLWRV